VTGNTSLTEGRVVDLLDRLDACENPYACPHGRPVVIRIDREEIGSRFERDYPATPAAGRSDWGPRPYDRSLDGGPSEGPKRTGAFRTRTSDYYT